MAVSLHILTGPMYSAKSSRLLSILNSHSALIKRAIKPSVDTRAPGYIKSRNGQEHLADFSVHSLSAVPLPTVSTPSTLYAIDEAQFFDDLLPFHDDFLKTARQVGGSHTLVIAGLDLDFNRRPFGKLLELAKRSILHSEETNSRVVTADYVFIERLSARCSFKTSGGDVCNAPALFSQRIAGGGDAIVLIEEGSEGEGGGGRYAPYCHKHHHVI
jgi:thymidine kinase